MRLYLSRDTADVGVDPAVDVGTDERADVDGDPAVDVGTDQAVDVGVDPTAGEPEDRTADVGVDPAVQTGADGAARVGVGLTVDEAALGDDVEPATVKPTQSRLGNGNPRGEMTYLVQILEPPTSGFHVHQHGSDATFRDESTGDSPRRSRIPVSSRSPVLTSPEPPDGTRRGQTRIPVRRRDLEPTQHRQRDASRDRMSSSPRTQPDLRRSSRLAQRRN
ncbi:hypothetical protein EGW08_014560 [Elysia chlorotica]|uniref:Uncharacterized protein n=1 Tax=Elysia chlorotica TaxID=188477 RepID=A0A3S1BCU3_ELYCH|nr:hypothetical protein EGW08_014560 [Elysia chlorotica]